MKVKNLTPLAIEIVNKKHAQRKIMKIEYQLTTLLSIWGFSQPWGTFFSIVAKMHLLHKTVLAEGYALPVQASHPACQLACATTHHLRDLCSRARYQGLFSNPVEYALDSFDCKKDAMYLDFLLCFLFFIQTFFIFSKLPISFSSFRNGFRRGLSL